MSSEQRVREMNRYYAERMKYYDEGATAIEDNWVTPELVEHVKRLLAGRDVLEVACGTGLWTEWLAPAAASITATDYSVEALEIAARKPFPPGKVKFQQADAYALSACPGPYGGHFSADWWSHIPISKRQEFLRAVNARLKPGAVVVVIDQRYWPKTKEFRDNEGNWVQGRTVRDGRRFDVVKNFPSKEEMLADVAPWATDIEYREFENCGPKKTGRWCLSYIAKPTAVGA